MAEPKLTYHRHPETEFGSLDWASLDPQLFAQTWDVGITEEGRWTVQVAVGDEQHEWILPASMHFLLNQMIAFMFEHLTGSRLDVGIVSKALAGFAKEEF